MFLRFVCLLTCLAALMGCGVEGAHSRGTEAPTQPDEVDLPVAARLSIVEGSSLRLAAGAEGVVEVLYTDLDGDPIADGVVSFALMGRAGDASLMELDVVTDAGGMARNTLIAGAGASVFQLRVRAVAADPVYVDVAISDTGFGSLSVTADYSGQRFVAQRTLVAQADVTCNAALRQVGDPMLTLTEAGPATFEALPAGHTYAVTALAEGPESLVMAEGCVDRVLVRADEVTNTIITFADVPLTAGGAFDMVLALDSSEPAQVLCDTIELASRTRIESDETGQPAPLNAEARLLLDALEATLRSAEYETVPGAADAADALAMERLSPSLGDGPDKELQASLDLAGVGALLALQTLQDRASVSLAKTRMELVLDVKPSSSNTDTDWLPQRLLVPAPVAGGDEVTLDLGDLKAVQRTADFDADRDRIRAEAVELDAPWGNLGSQVLAAILGETTGLGPELTQQLGCQEFGTWVATSPQVSATCDSDCVVRACGRALNAFTSAAEMELLALDTLRPTTRLDIDAVLKDEDGDLTADAMDEGSVQGAWLDADDAQPGDLLVGSVSGQAQDP